MSTTDLARGTRLHQEAVAEHAAAREQAQHVTTQPDLGS